MNFWRSNWELVLIVSIGCATCTVQQATTAKKSIECVDRGGTWHQSAACSADFCERPAK